MIEETSGNMKRRFMLLWTWQRKGFSITDGGIRVDSRRYSDYLSGDYSSAGFEDAYEDLWSILATDQFHWYYTLEQDARRPSDINQGKMLWTVEAPEEGILCRVCNYAWIILAGEPPAMPPDWFRWAHRFLRRFTNGPYREDGYAGDFAAGWSQMNREDILDSLLACSAHDVECTQVLLKHPVPKGWIAKEPEEYTQAVSAPSR